MVHTLLSFTSASCFFSLFGLFVFFSFLFVCLFVFLRAFHLTTGRGSYWTCGAFAFLKLVYLNVPFSLWEACHSFNVSSSFFFSFGITFDVLLCLPIGFFVVIIIIFFLRNVKGRDLMLDFLVGGMSLLRPSKIYLITNISFSICEFLVQKGIILE